MRVDSKVRLVRSTSRTALIGFATLYFSGLALGKYNNDEDEAAAKAAWTPNIYLDLQTTYATIPANTLAIGLGSPSLLASFPTLATLSNFTNLPLPPTLPTPSSPATQSIGVDVPLTVDISDRISIMGRLQWHHVAYRHVRLVELRDQRLVCRISGTTSINRMADRSRRSRCSRPSRGRCRIRPLARTSFNTIAEFDYALNEDETRGLLAGMQYTRIDVDTSLVTVNPNIVGYVGGYHQWTITGSSSAASAFNHSATRASEPDAISAFYPADRKVRSGPDGRQ